MAHREQSPFPRQSHRPDKDQLVHDRQLEPAPRSPGQMLQLARRSAVQTLETTGAVVRSLLLAV
jgi:hypothetical protein